MSNFKHTSGTWKADTTNIIPSVNSFEYASRKLPKNICNIHRTQDQEESIANTKLIAAAPDMLQAITNVINDQDMFGKVQPSTIEDLVNTYKKATS